MIKKAKKRFCKKSCFSLICATSIKQVIIGLIPLSRKKEEIKHIIEEKIKLIIK